MMSANPADSAGTHDRWTSLSIALHWTIVALLVVQFIDHEWMVDLFDASNEGRDVASLTRVLGYTHIAAGLAILIAAAIRLWDRFAHGRPAHSSDEPNWAQALAKATHVLLYTLLLSMPVAGLAAWILGSEWIATIHLYAWKVLLVTVALHVAGALANHFWFKNDVLRRIMPGQRRRS